MPRRVRLRENSARRRLIWAFVYTLVGLGSGVLSRFLRPYLDGPVHYEAIASWFFLMIMSFVSMRSNRFQPRRVAMIDFHVQLFLLWYTFMIGWSVVHGSFWEDIAFVFGAWWLGAAFIGTVAIVLLQKFNPPRIGPYCPGCGYHLVGLSQQICPECGRGFSINELGINEEELAISPNNAPED